MVLVDGEAQLGGGGRHLGRPRHIRADRPATDADLNVSPEDRLAILDAYSRYCLDFDSGRAAQAAAHFTPDGQFLYVGSRRFDGRDSIAAMFARRHAAAPGMRHFVSNIVLDPGRELRTAVVAGQAYVIVLRLQPGAPLRVVTVGQYDDTWVKLDEGWRIRRRAYTAWLDASLIDATLVAPPA